MYTEWDIVEYFFYFDIFYDENKMNRRFLRTNSSMMIRLTIHCNRKLCIIDMIIVKVFTGDIVVRITCYAACHTHFKVLDFKSLHPSHYIRSSNDTLLLKMPSCKTKVTLGDRAFSCAAPKIWNNLPLSIRKSQSVTSFKTKLKIHLFVQSFQ